MTDDRRTVLRGRYLSLGLGELFAAVVFTWVASVSVLPLFERPSDALAFWSALAPLLLILVQAGVYWLAARRWVEQGTMPPGLAAAFRGFRVLDAVLLLAGLVGIIAWFPAHPFAAIGIPFVWLLGVTEYVNYFVIRLAYPPSVWFKRIGEWRTPRLMQDVRAAQRS
ncbi:hypothetical protein SAMN06295974_3525 [Plantibacter flavus]|uniref:Uncharacterized protein n=1 Tax=Plantibacter flavus TaxID=150123 RepID=A0A3N2C6E3_9MICO|nr:hypothetical protein [Plantibacter flavus]ROR83071.1 hypothetical protein EDD42_3173 [Plantibacter flavus]SMG46582.1 hypothetical protein SAMN06295974_3525 [Plantibacter flavus]